MVAPNPPHELAIGAARYTMDASLSTVKREATTGAAREVVFESSEPAIAVVRTSELRQGESRVGPVYRSVPGGGVVVPTGRVFVRVAKGDRVLEHAERLHAAGYRVSSIPTWSPESAFLEPESGTVESALAGLAGLSRIVALEHVEPELLRARARRF